MRGGDACGEGSRDQECEAARGPEGERPRGARVRGGQETMRWECDAVRGGDGLRGRGIQSAMGRGGERARGRGGESESRLMHCARGGWGDREGAL